MTKLLALLPLIASLTIAPDISAKIAKPQKAIDHPEYASRSTGAIKPTRIELYKDSTVIDFDVHFKAGLQINVDTNLVMKDGHQTAKPINIKGLIFGTWFTMPESGHYKFSLTYPAVKGNPKTIDLDELGGSWRINGLRLDNKSYGRKSIKELSAGDEARSVPESDSIVYAHPRPIKLTGVMQGYDKSTFGDNFLIYDIDEITDTSRPIAVKINDDGTFEANMEARMAKNVLAVFNDYAVRYLYLEPGRNLHVYIDMDGILDQYSGLSANETMIYNTGDMGVVNNESQNSPAFWGWRSLPVNASTPYDQCIWMVLNRHIENQDKKERYYRDFGISERSQKYIDCREIANMLTYLLDYQMSKRDDAHFNKKQAEETPIEFFDFIKKYLTDDAIMTTEAYGILLNRLEYCGLEKAIGAQSEYPVIAYGNGLEYFRSRNISVDKDLETRLQLLADHDGEELWWTMDSIFRFNSGLQKALDRNNLKTAYNQLCDSLKQPGYLSVAHFDRTNIHNYIKKTKAICEYLGVNEPPLWWQLLCANRLTYQQELNPSNVGQADALNQIREMTNNGVFTYQGIINALNDFYANAFNESSELPDTEGGNLIRKMIEPYKGRYIMLDLWATSCGPCIAGIVNSKDFRMKNINNPKFKGIFITTESQSPKAKYDEFVAENLIGEDSYYLKNSEFNLLRELFGFNGIPRYVLIGPEGRVINKKFDGYYMLQKFLDDHNIEYNK